MKKGKPLSPVDKLFVAEYLVDHNATRAYTVAHPACKSNNTARVESARCLAKPAVAARVAELTKVHLGKVDLTAQRVLEELRRLAFLDPAGFYDTRGNILPIHAMAPEVRACLAGSETIIKNAKAGDGITDEVLKIKHYDKTKALEILAKYFGLLVERVQVETIETKLYILDEGRRRNAAMEAEDAQRALKP